MSTVFHIDLLIQGLLRRRYGGKKLEFDTDAQST